METLEINKIEIEDCRAWSYGTVQDYTIGNFMVSFKNYETNEVFEAKIECSDSETRDSFHHCISNMDDKINREYYTELSKRLKEAGYDPSNLKKFTVNYNKGKVTTYDFTKVKPE